MPDDNNLIELTIEVVSAFVGKNNIRPDDLPAFIASTHAAIKGLDAAVAAPAPDAPAGEEFIPAVTARKSLSSPDHIISLIDGKPYRTLRRHLSSNGLTPEEYRARYKLKADYPMVAPAYSETRKALAQKIGLGRKPKAEVVSPPKRTRAPKPAPETVEG